MAPARDGSLVLGCHEQQASTESRGNSVITACAATVEALRLLGAGRVALYSPPWFDSELNRRGRRYYQDAGV